MAEMLWLLWHFLSNHLELAIVGAITLIQIAPIKINPWGWIGKQLKHAIMGDVEQKIDSISKKVDALEATMEEDKASQARNHILRFADELYEGKHHGIEYFQQMLDDVKFYEAFCEKHPKFPNGRTVDACEKIRTTYDELWKNHKF